jgi:hypothetical protein
VLFHFGYLTPSNIENDTWVSTTPAAGVLPSARAYHTAVYKEEVETGSNNIKYVYKENMIVFGGRNEIEVFNDVYSYNIGK